MKMSHESCRDLYDCSSENLEKLINISKSVDCYGRLTGAGWGGCSIFMVKEKDADNLI